MASEKTTTYRWRNEMGPSPLIYARDPADVVVVDTTDETDLFTFTAEQGVLDGDKGFRFTVRGSLTNDLAVGGLPPTPTATFRWYIGATLVWEDSVYVADDAAVVTPWAFNVEVLAKNSAAIQELYGLAHMGSPSMPATGEGKIGAGNNVPIYGSATEDATEDVVIRITVELSDADASFECVKRMATVENL